MKKIFAILLSLGMVFSVATTVTSDDKKAKPLTAQELEAAHTVAMLLDEGMESNDAVLLMAAAKLMPKMGSASLLKDAKHQGDKNVKDADIWSVSDVYAAAAKAAGAGSELGKEAMEMAKKSKQSANEEGCYGYTHYHIIYFYDRYGRLRYYTIWHNC